MTQEVSARKKYKMATKSPDLITRSNKKALLITFLTLVVIGVVVFVLLNAFKAGGSEEQRHQMTEVAYQEVKASTAKDLVSSEPDLVILDVSDKYEAGHLPGAVNVRLKEIETNLDKIDKNKPVLVYARYKVKSVEVVDVLTKSDVSQVYRLKGEYQAWADADYEVEEGGGSGKINDLDGDGLDNDKEKELGSNPLKGDTDGDGLLDCQEEKLGTNLLEKDTDGDGYSDKAELDTKHDPLATPDEEQKKSRVSEEIILWSNDYIGEEGKATRHMKEGRFILEVEALLARPKDGGFYEVFIGENNMENKIEAGKMELTDSVDYEGLPLGSFNIKFESQEDYYSYVDIFIVRRSADGQEESVALKGEFDRVEN